MALGIGLHQLDQRPGLQHAAAVLVGVDQQLLQPAHPAQPHPRPTPHPIKELGHVPVCRLLGAVQHALPHAEEARVGEQMGPVAARAAEKGR